MDKKKTSGEEQKGRNGELSGESAQITKCAQKNGRWNENIAKLNQNQFEFQSGSVKNIKCRGKR